MEKKHCVLDWDKSGKILLKVPCIEVSWGTTSYYVSLLEMLCYDIFIVLDVLERRNLICLFCHLNLDDQEIFIFSME